MSYSQALSKYLVAYNAMQVLINNPLLEEGVLDTAKTELTGKISYSRVEEFDDITLKIETEINTQIEAQTHIMDEQRAAILEFFTEKTHDLESILMPGETQIITVLSGVIVVRDATDADYPGLPS